MTVTKLTCPACAVVLTLKTEMPAGKMIKCPKCAKVFPVPAGSAAATAAAPAQPPAKTGTKLPAQPPVKTAPKSPSQPPAKPAAKPVPAAAGGKAASAGAAQPIPANEALARPSSERSLARKSLDLALKGSVGLARFVFTNPSKKKSILCGTAGLCFLLLLFVGYESIASFFSKDPALAQKSSSSAEPALARNSSSPAEPALARNSSSSAEPALARNSSSSPVDKASSSSGEPSATNDSSPATSQGAGSKGTAEESVELPMLTVPSTDPSLPGTWHILDRSKSIRKLIDRKSLFPVGKRELVFIETSRTMVLSRKTNGAFLTAALPGDIGNEQTLLGCMPWVRTEKGADLPFKVVFHQAKGHGMRLAQLVVEDFPGEVRVVMGIHHVLLNPPPLTQAQRSASSVEFISRMAKHKSWDNVPGFPKPAFSEGGPQFVGVKPAASYGQTIYNIFRATDKVVAYKLASELETYDPDVAKANGQGPCGPRARVAEKALFGVARAISVSMIDDLGAIPHVFEIIEDPETGHYFIGDVSTPEPSFCPHWGYCYIMGPAQYDGIPNAFKVDLGFRSQPIIATFAARNTDIKFNSPTALIGSSHPGHKGAATCQARLKKLPDEFRDLERKLLKE